MWWYIIGSYVVLWAMAALFMSYKLEKDVRKAIKLRYIIELPADEIQPWLELMDEIRTVRARSRICGFIQMIAPNILWPIYMPLAYKDYRYTLLKATIKGLKRKGYIATKK